ncbi:MAG TPA: hypothetical protein VHM01_04620 [Alphaproteobacteria bacterium]|nr:hypothetical protein [Alphaproteobacteria bacterium]
MRCACLVLAAAVAGCAGPVHPTYEFEALYAPAIATPSGINSDLAAYAAQICGRGDYDVLDQLFVGEAGPSYVRIRFACS